MRQHPLAAAALDNEQSSSSPGDWLRADLAECIEFLETDSEERRAIVRTVLIPWLNDPAFAGLRDSEAMDPLPPAERDECRALWLDVEALAKE